MREAFTQYGKLFYQSEKQCETCGEYLTGKRVEGMEKLFCSNCIFDKKQAQDEENQKEWTEKAYQSKAIHRMKGSSLVKDKWLWDSSLNNYKPVDRETQKALELAHRAVNALNEGETLHVVFSGTAGAGKTTLSMGILKEVLAHDVNKHCMIIDYQYLLEEKMRSFSDNSIVKSVDKIMRDSFNSDILIIDDIGAETSRIENRKQTASDFTIKTLNSILQARVNKSTIITTNLTGAQIKQAYGDRVASRLLAHSEGYIMAFKETKDKRRYPIK